jgi:flavin-dependent dehydrogenase
MIFDVVIAGAGPAGCAAAIRAATSGLRVALIERAAFPRVLPGEALHPGVDELFAELGVRKAIAAASFTKCPGWILEHSGERTFIPFMGRSGLQFGYQTWRAELDSILLARARETGVRVAQPANIDTVIHEDDRVVGVEVNGERWLGRYVVDASGATGWLSRRLQLDVQQFSPMLVARYAYYRDDRAGVIPEFREHSCGWTWLARLKKDHCQCVQLSLAAGADLPPVPDGVPCDTRFRGANVTWRLVKECAGAGYFLCGDAAAVLDPAASSGVARALGSGLKAADLIVQIERKRMDWQTAAAAYRRWYAELFIDQARQLASRYGNLDAPPVWLDGLEARLAKLEQLVSNPLANSAGAVITS